MMVQPTAAETTQVIMRLPNSMAPCTPMAEVAVRLSSLHLGQVSQPRPEPVSRTAPPVTTMTMLISSAASAARSTVRGEGVQRAAMYATGLRTSSSSFGTKPW